MGINDRWFIQIPCSLEGKNTPKYEYLSALDEDMRIEAPEKKIFYAIKTDTREEAEKILEEVKKNKIKYDSRIFLGEKYQKGHDANLEVILIKSKFSFGKELMNCIFDDRYGRNHIFWGDQYIGRDYVEFLNFQKNFKIDFLTFSKETIGRWKNIGSKKVIKFSKETISADLEEEIFKVAQKFAKINFLKFFDGEKKYIKIYKYNNNLYLYLEVNTDRKDLKNIYQKEKRIFIFELDFFLKSGRIIERDLDDDFIKIRSQISNLSIDRHDSIAF